MIYPSKHWENFFNKFNQIDTLDISAWKEVHFLSYFCKRYKEVIGVDFAFSFKGAPSKCPEMVMIKKIIAMLNCNNNDYIKYYIDWVFDNKIKPNKMQIKSLAFFLTPGIGNEFNIFMKNKNKITRSTELPMIFKELLSDLDITLDTYGDLAFFQQSVKENKRDDYCKVLNRLYVLGLDPKILENIV